MFRIILFAFSILAAFLCSDWKNWKQYYPTILYFIICSLLYIVLFNNHLLWKYEPIPPLDDILYNNTYITLAVTFIVFPATALIYFTNYPKGNKQYIYIALWVGIYSLIEAISITQNAISYHNGWHFGWSVFFNVVLFSFLSIHYSKPLIAWLISPVFIVFIFTLFH